eukprot:7312761-Karenia_brevis.AAC.1
MALAHSLHQTCLEKDVEQNGSAEGLRWPAGQAKTLGGPLAGCRATGVASQWLLTRSVSSSSGAEHLKTPNP